jgi:CysZ protein
MSFLPDPQTASFQRQFSYGLGLPVAGVRRMFTDRRLWPYVVMPVAITAGLIVVAWVVAFGYAPDIVDGIIQRPGGRGVNAMARWVAYVLTSVLVHVATGVVASVVAWFAGGILASPVYDRLSAKVEALELGDTDESFSFKLVAQDVAQGVTHSLLAMVLYLSLACPIGLFSLVPAVGQVVGIVCGAGLSSFFLAREVLDYSLSRRRLSFRDKVGLVWRHRPLTGGMGFATFLMLSVPFANFLSMPAAVIGGTLLYCQLERDGHVTPAARVPQG